jgi:hypothetical protein
MATRATRAPSRNGKRLSSSDRRLSNSRKTTVGRTSLHRTTGVGSTRTKGEVTVAGNRDLEAVRHFPYAI